MTTLHEAKCSCGYKTTIFVGGNRASYQKDSSFPFYCQQCGVVEINITLKDLCCPSCHSSEILQYGKEPVSVQPIEESFPILMNNDYGAYQNGNLCPKCKTRNMIFSIGVNAFILHSSVLG